MNYSWKLNNFDSEILGFKVAKIEVLNPRDVKSLIKDFIKNKIKYTTYRVESNNFPMIHALERAGFILVDGLITLEINTSETGTEISASQIREANKNDLDKLKEITNGLYSISRIFNDSIISKDKANKFYIKWVENSVLGKTADLVLVWEEEKNILGYITLQKKGQIPLIGVFPQARGKGIAKKLIKASFNRFREWGSEIIRIETQMGNIPALRVYQDCGFKVVNSFLTLRWLDHE